MKKRIMALILVLALAMAMMVPVFAASGTYHTHTWVSASASVTKTISYNNIHTHQVTYTMEYICSGCAQRKTEVTSSYAENHNPQLGYCGICGGYAAFN